MNATYNPRATASSVPPPTLWELEIARNVDVIRQNISDLHQFHLDSNAELKQQFIQFAMQLETISQALFGIPNVCPTAAQQGFHFSTPLPAVRTAASAFCIGNSTSSQLDGSSSSYCNESSSVHPTDALASWGVSPSILSKDSSGKWRFIGCHSYIPEQNWRFVKSSASVSVYIKRFTDVCMAAQGLNPQDFSVTGKKGPGEAVAKPAIPQSAMSQIKAFLRLRLSEDNNERFSFLFSQQSFSAFCPDASYQFDLVTSSREGVPLLDNHFGDLGTWVARACVRNHE